MNVNVETVGDQALVCLRGREVTSLPGGGRSLTLRHKGLKDHGPRGYQYDKPVPIPSACSRFVFGLLNRAQNTPLGLCVPENTSTFPTIKADEILICLFCFFFSLSSGICSRCRVRNVNPGRDNEPGDPALPPSGPRCALPRGPPRRRRR